MDANLREVPRICDKIARKEREGKTFFSFEYFPPKTEAGVENLYARIDRMASLEPLFCDITWGAGGSTANLTMDIATNIQKYQGLDCMMHLTCTNMAVGVTKEALKEAKEKGIHNILALRGDPPVGEEWKAAVDGFEHAIDLVKFIRQQYGDYFSITVAGYPEGHPDGYLADKISYEEELANLKAKVDAGADVIITQMFFDVDLFLKFVKKCRDAGIMVPIVPGILPLMSYNGFQKMTGFCKTAVPPELSEALEQVKGDDAAVKDLGIRYGVDMCRKILKSGLCPGIHFYTLNTENSVMAMVDALGFVSSTEAIRSLPFRKSTFDPRRTERVRPIYWANRFKSYLFRTTNWEKYPEIQWTNGAARMFLDPPKENILNNVDATPEAAKKLLEHYGELDSIAAVQAMFAKYYSKELANFPWCEKDGLYEQASLLKSQLLWMCKLGLLPINAQARANGIPSSDPVLGWGAKNGLVYQKAYVEFFAPKDQLEALIESAKEHPTVSISALSSQTDTIVPKTMDFATAATWGVFPNHEILQPWVLDPVSFKAWSDEAFGIWRSLAIHYGLGSTSSKTINRVADTYYLVSMLDNDYAQGDIFKVIAASIRN